MDVSCLIARIFNSKIDIFNVCIKDTLEKSENVLKEIFKLKTDGFN